jgi:hypothetical protein
VTARARTLRPSRSGDVLFIAFVAVLGWCAFKQTSPRGPLGGWVGAWFMVAVATCTVVLKWVALFTHRGYLKIEGQGFRLRRGGREVFFPRADVAGFRVGHWGSRRVVCFDYAPGARHQRRGRALPEGDAAGDERIVDDYALEPEALAELLNRGRVEGMKST